MAKKTKPQDKSKFVEIDENITRIFDIKKRLGKGAYGIVWKALDKRTNQTLAVKKIFDAFRDETDAQRTFREIIFLKAFKNHPNVIKLLSVYRATNNLDIYLIFEYMESDLHNIIKKGTILKEIHKSFVMYQLINAVKYIHSGNVMHRDLKPSNILIDSKCRCKLADFGLARSLSNRSTRDKTDNASSYGFEPLLTDYVATRWYRAPEILVASKRYTKGIDMWSLGCILGEMIRGKPLFQGSSTINQIEKIVSALPDITEHDINAVGVGFGTVLLDKRNSTDECPSLADLISSGPPDARALVHSLLVLDPLSRLTAQEALFHPYVERFRNASQEIDLRMDVMLPYRDDVRRTVTEYRTKLYEVAQIPKQKHTFSQYIASGKYIVSGQRPELVRYEPEAVKKFSKPSQGNRIKSPEKSLSKEQCLTKLDSNGDQTSKKTFSPVPKRRMNRIPRLIPPSAPAPAGMLTRRVGSVQPKNKTLCKNSNAAGGILKTSQPEKKPPLDCGCVKTLPVAYHKPSAKTISYHIVDSYVYKDTSNRRLRDNFSQSQKTDNTLHNRGVRKDTKVVPNERQYKSTPLIGSTNKTDHVRNIRSDVIPAKPSLIPKTIKKTECMCYEKRLKDLEEEMEKYRKEVKSFFRNCSQAAKPSHVCRATAMSSVASRPHCKLRPNGRTCNANLPTIHSSGMSAPKKHPSNQLISHDNNTTGAGGDNTGRIRRDQSNISNNHANPVNRTFTQLSKFI